MQTEYIIASRKAAARRQRITLGAVSFGLVLAIVLTIVALIQRGKAVEQGKIAKNNADEADRQKEAAVASLSQSYFGEKDPSVARACSFAVREGMDHRNSKSRFSRLPRATLIGVMAFFAILATTSRAAEESEYKPPAGDVYVMEGHSKWCAEGKTVGARIKRYEEFWSLQSPKESDGYDDERHIRLVRRCAYRLAELYAQAGHAKECLKTLNFLEKEDDTFKLEKED